MHPQGNRATGTIWRNIRKTIVGGAVVLATMLIGGVLGAIEEELRRAFLSLWRIVAIIVAMVAAVALTAAALRGLWWFWWTLPKREVDRLRPIIFDPAARVNAEDNIRKTVGQLIGGAAVLIGAGLGVAFAYVQFSQQQKSSHELLISNQVSKGFEQLGSDKLLVRLGGIYALEGVMNTSEQYRQPVLEALSAFVRDGTRNLNDDGPPTTDIQAALTVIGRLEITGVIRLTARSLPEVLNYHAIELENARLPQHIRGLGSRANRLPPRGTRDGWVRRLQPEC
jgi:hypothetical protein